MSVLNGKMLAIGLELYTWWKRANYYLVVSTVREYSGTIKRCSCGHMWGVLCCLFGSLFLWFFPVVGLFDHVFVNKPTHEGVSYLQVGCVNHVVLFNGEDCLMSSATISWYFYIEKVILIRLSISIIFFVVKNEYW